MQRTNELLFKPWWNTFLVKHIKTRQSCHVLLRLNRVETNAANLLSIAHWQAKLFQNIVDVRHLLIWMPLFIRCVIRWCTVWTGWTYVVVAVDIAYATMMTTRWCACPVAITSGAKLKPIHFWVDIALDTQPIQLPCDLTITFARRHCPKKEICFALFFFVLLSQRTWSVW